MYGAIGRAGEGVFLAVAKHIAEAIVVAAFKDEVTHRRVVLQSDAASYAIVKLALYVEVVLRHHIIGARRHALLIGGPHGATLVAVANADTYLRPCLEEELQAALLLTPRQPCEDGQLQVAHVAAIAVLQSFALKAADVFFPTQLRVVEFGIEGAIGSELFLAHVFQRQTQRRPHVHLLLDGRVEIYAVQHHTCIGTKAKHITLLSYLGVGNIEH